MPTDWNRKLVAASRLLRIRAEMALEGARRAIPLAVEPEDAPPDLPDAVS